MNFDELNDMMKLSQTQLWSSACWRQQFRHLSAFDGFRYYLIFINHVRLIKKPIPLLFKTFLCSTCEQNHMKNRKWKTHTVLKLSDINDPSDFSYDVLCSVHTCKPLEEYCAGEDCAGFLDRQECSRNDVTWDILTCSEVRSTLWFLNTCCLFSDIVLSFSSIYS
jgi:hypothetical protein